MGPYSGLRVRLDGPHLSDNRHAVPGWLAAAPGVSGPRELQLALVRHQDGAHHLYLPVDPVEPSAPEDGPAHGSRVEDTRAGLPDLAVRHRGRDARVPFGVLEERFFTDAPARTGNIEGDGDHPQAPLRQQGNAAVPGVQKADLRAQPRAAYGGHGPLPRGPAGHGLRPGPRHPP